MAGDDITLIAAVSGGPDSVCLLHLLWRLRSSQGFTLHAAHLDHQLRGEASRADAGYVAGLCHCLDIPLTLERADVQGYRRRKRMGLEEAARHCRLEFFATVAKATRAQAVLLGHTANDQVETVLLHILRGAGLRGLRGMAPITRWNDALVLARPLLTTWRRQTEAYCEEQELRPRLDASNRSQEFARNRVRLQVLPALRAVNPAADRAILRLAENAGEAAAFLEAATARAWRRLVRRDDDALAIRRDGFLRLPSAIQAELLRLAVRTARDTLEDTSAEHVRRMLALAAGPVGKTTHLPRGLVFSVDYEALRLGPASRDRQTPPLEGEPPLRVPGSAQLPGWTVTAKLASFRRRPTGDAFTALLDPALASRPLCIRGRRPGDRFQPLGMASTKKLQDFLVDAKVPRAQRDGVPLLCDAEGILWVVGHRLDERARVPDRARRALRVQFRRREGTSP